MCVVPRADSIAKSPWLLPSNSVPEMTLPCQPCCDPELRSLALRVNEIRYGSLLTWASRLNLIFYLQFWGILHGYTRF